MEKDLTTDPEICPSSETTQTPTLPTMAVEKDVTPQDHRIIRIPIEDGRNNSPPILAEVPKQRTFRFPERYRSPTDLMVSPVSKGLLARNRKHGIILPPTTNASKILESSFKDVGLLPI
ncbi:hypothetical protein AMTRI_Chr10g226060 [Amborella trichopoda]|uniref:Uncharacterized protein n=1 Tax=Amborella trichopoda TaxID=13333 RepID=W1PHQ4_AMBTC|nr:uncharacterized protein LOC110007392 [Amborella trichopoda]ERN07523.1 hypothetical protein AMTR_s00154p00036430 [Amborella trichopoda]|eukprot:XP_020523839.1 uncharacterized protein LOC110007392 [Amborella trichopoda]